MIVSAMLKIFFLIIVFICIMCLGFYSDLGSLPKSKVYVLKKTQHGFFNFYSYFLHFYNLSTWNLFCVRGLVNWSRSVVSNSLRPHDCSPPGFSIHGIFQARILEWVAISFSRGSSQPRNRTQVSCIAGRCFNPLSHPWSPRIVEWVAIPFSRGSSQPRDQTWVSCIAGRLFTVWATREAL